MYDYKVQKKKNMLVITQQVGMMPIRERTIGISESPSMLLLLENAHPEIREGRQSYLCGVTIDQMLGKFF